MPDRGLLRPHGENHKESDGKWHARIIDFDPVHGLVVVTATFVVWAAAIAWLARMRKLVG